jgi:hypothetical protein
LPQWLDTLAKHCTMPSPQDMGGLSHNAVDTQEHGKTASVYSSLRLLSENGLFSLRDAMLPRFDADDSSTIGVIGVRSSDLVSYEVMRCDIIGRGGSSDELSVNGLRSIEGEVSNSV